MANRLQLDLAADRKSVKLEFPEKVARTSVELENFIRELGSFRAIMQPVVHEGAIGPDTPWSIVPCTSWTVRTDHETPTRIRLFPRHPGFGWTSMPMDEAGTKRLAAALRKGPKLRPTVS